MGIDLAADPTRTGLAVVSGNGRCIVEDVHVGADDDDVVEAISTADKAGVDVPMGWPDRFVQLIQAHARGAVAAPASTGPEWRRGLAMRVTDRMVHRATGLTPLSVSTDRIAHPAMRWAGIEARLRDIGVDVARDGSGAVCEVYPAAALRRWSLPHRGYKGAKNAGERSALVVALSEKLARLEWNGHRDLCVADDNALDAVLAALVAREVSHGRGEPPPEELRGTARREGWIWLPEA
ncbi:DUF429 domain-containing protein [Brevibacterium daeguense]|uniref:DUF429 domain-containing protein n=1 Tax=Brevibacterium daeguense TaxID=909936 RepID=A0ABP8EJM0_9MICO